MYAYGPLLLLALVLACSSSNQAPVPVPTVESIASAGERFRVCLTETAAAQIAEDEGSPVQRQLERLSKICEGSGALSVNHGAVYGNCRTGEELQAQLKFYIDTAASLNRPATFAKMAKRQVDDALAVTTCFP
jgi:hypothetical protein